MVIYLWPKKKKKKCNDRSTFTVCVDICIDKQNNDACINNA